jgi:hypothetical protein
MKESFTRDTVYFVESEQDSTALIARFAGIREGFVFWDDTNRERAHPVESWETKGALITVRTQSGTEYRFRPLTLELYEERVKAQVELSPSFDSTEDLQAFYLSQSF